MSVALIASGLLTTLAYVSYGLEHDLDARARADLSARTELSAEAFSSTNAFDPRTADALARRLAHASGARVTLVGPDGSVRADSTVSLERVASLANHRERPEVRAALATGRGASLRRSETVHADLVYAARRIEAPDGQRWVLRLAVTPNLVAVQYAGIRRFLFVGAAMGLLLATVLSSLATRQFARPVQALTQTARAMLSDLAVRTRWRQGDELGDLARALDELADGLAASLASSQSERDRLHAILESMVEGVLVVDAEGRVRLANRALREMFLTGHEVLGRAPIEAVRNAELHDVVDEASRSRSAVAREISVTGVRPRRVAVSVAPLSAEGGRAAVAVLSDVTELRRLETVRRDFVANVSHELRTPIAAVRAAVETLDVGAIDDPAAAREFLAIIARHTDRLHRLVEDLLDLSRIEAKELALSLEPLDARAALEHAAELFALAAEKKRVRLSVDVREPSLCVHADRVALEHVLTNLIDNAIKYVSEGASVTVRGATLADAPSRADDARRVRITVEDTGPGIEARHLPRIFERFYRVDAGRSRQLGGTGLGLAIVKHLAEAMGAAVGVESTPGVGTRFHVDLRAGAPSPPTRAHDDDKRA